MQEPHPAGKMISEQRAMKTQATPQKLLRVFGRAAGCTILATFLFLSQVWDEHKPLRADSEQLAPPQVVKSP
jgi:hypothetical protein